MSQTKTASLPSRIAFLLGGLASLVLVGFLLWAGFSIPLNSRRPVPSPDGKYFAYFNPVEAEADAGAASFELILAQPRGKLLGRLPIAPGGVAWSNAGHLVVVHADGTQATLIANAGDRFLVLTKIPLYPGAEPRWATDGTKLAAVRTTEAGPQLAIYDIQQPQAFPVPFPADFHLNQPRLLAWSPGSEFVYFLNAEGKEFLLQRVDVRGGNVQTLARGILQPGEKLPRMSPDGSKFFLREPQNSVIDTQTGSVVWTLPPGAEALWWPWSPDSRGLFYARAANSSEVLVHDFASSSDPVMVSGAKSNGFFAVDGRTYFFRDSSAAPQAGANGEGGWRRDSWGWQQIDRASPAPLSLGRTELWPWEQTLEGFILARQDAYTQVRYGLYDPDTRTLEPYVFPTEQEDLRRQVRAQRLLLVTAAIYALLAGISLVRRPASRSARTFYILALFVLALICTQLIGAPEAVLRGTSPYRMRPEEIAALGWSMTSALPQLVFERVRLTIAGLWALLPLAALQFGLAFPDKSRTLRQNPTWTLAAYGAALLPVVATALSHLGVNLPLGLVPGLLVASGGAVAAVWVMRLAANLRRPPDPRSGVQVRWVAAALSLLITGTVALLLLRTWEGRAAGEGLSRLIHSIHTSLFALVAWVVPAAIAYAVAARKPVGVRTSLRRVARQALTGVPAVLVFLIAWAATGLVIRGALWAFSGPAIIIAVLVAAIALMPFRGRLRVAADRLLNRARFESGERLKDFARGLPHTLDRETLAGLLGEVLPRATGARWGLLWVIDRGAHKLRLQPGSSRFPAEARGVEFDLHEPLCEFLGNGPPVLEMGVASEDPSLAPLLESAQDRLGKVQAEVVLALRRNELLGLLVIGAKASGELYDNEEIDLLKLVAREAASAVENIELFEAAARHRELRKELEDAAEIQARLLPASVPRLRSAQIVGRCFPARSTRGDHYDFVEMPGRKVGLALADVTGQGMAASLLMASVGNLLRAQAPTAASLPEMLERINQQLRASSPEVRFCSLFYAVYDDASRRLVYVNAGHPPPLLLTEEGAQFLDSTGPVLGLLPEVAHQTRTISLEPGAILLIYSDGVIETRNSRGEAYGRDRLTLAVAAARAADAERLFGRVLADIRDFEGGVPLEDDQTLVLLKINPS